MAPPYAWGGTGACWPRVHHQRLLRPKERQNKRAGIPRDSQVGKTLAMPASAFGERWLLLPDVEREAQAPRPRECSLLGRLYIHWLPALAAPTFALPP